MRGVLLRWLANSVAIWVVAQLLSGIEVKGMKGAIVAAAVLGILNALVRPLLLLLTLPLTVLTLGLSTLLINGFLLIVTSKITSSLVVQGFWPALWGALLISLLSTLIGWFLN